MKKLTLKDFQELWVPQECEVDEDQEQLETAIEESDDWEELFTTIRMWSNKPLVERVNNFLKRNNAELYSEVIEVMNKVATS